ncbi:MAG: M23 family metallopeptidase [Proteobacteria bacterium]|nr:M23 family metallopeptidase [Pseudomonadota bacterium]
MIKCPAAIACAAMMVAATLCSVIWGPPACAAAVSAHAPPLLRPVQPGCVTSPFGPRYLAAAPVAGRFHWGVDLRAPAGARVVAVAPGRIIRIDREGMGGLEVLVQHAGFRALYAHLGMVAPAIADGAKRLRAGQWIGRVGRTGLTLGTHLYFEIIENGTRVDPAPYLGVVPCGAGKSALVRPSNQ